MSVSAIFGTRLAIPLKPNSYSAATKAAPPSRVSVGDVGLTIECSSRPQKKATKHHMKSRPRKTNPSDIRRGPTVYPPLPPMPPEWSFVSEDDGAAAEEPQEAVESR